MSGGSYDYLFIQDGLSELTEHRSALQAMAERLSGLSEVEFPGARSAAVATWRLHTLLGVWEAHVEAQVKVLGGVWRAVEWWDSGDSGADGVQRALEALLVPAAAVVEVPAVVHWSDPDPNAHGAPFCGVRRDLGVRSTALVGDVTCPTCLHGRRCVAFVPKGGGVQCDKPVGHDGPHAWGAGPFTRPTQPKENP